MLGKTTEVHVITLKKNALPLLGESYFGNDYNFCYEITNKKLLYDFNVSFYFQERQYCDSGIFCLANYLNMIYLTRYLMKVHKSVFFL